MQPVLRSRSGSAIERATFVAGFGLLLVQKCEKKTYFYVFSKNGDFKITRKPRKIRAPGKVRAYLLRGLGLPGFDFGLRKPRKIRAPGKV